MEEDTANNLADDITELQLEPDHNSNDFAQTQQNTRRSEPGSHPNQDVQDISSNFRAAASALNTGQLVKDPYFTLFEAVGALEIMDPKMDSGFLAEGDTLEDDYDVLQPMLPDELIGLMDQLLCHEEEDFVSNLYNRSLLSRFDTIQIQGVLSDALESVERLSLGNTQVRDAILARLRFRRQILEALASDLATDKTTQIQHWTHCLELLPQVRETRKPAKAVPKASSVKIQRTLASSVPPRPMVEVAFEDAHEFLRHLCQAAAEVYQILDCNGSSSVLNFTSIFQSRKPQPPVYIRCLLQSLIFHDMKVLGTFTITKFIFDDLEELVLPADILLDPANANVEPPHDPRFQVAREMRDFVLRVGDPFLDMFRVIAMNRSRMRRMLCHLVLDWETVQLQAENLDEELRKYTAEKPLTEGETAGTELWSFPLSSWAYYYKLRQMEWIIQLGFELEVYHNDELSGMYWYLSHVAAAIIQHMERIQTFVARRLRQSKKYNVSQKQSFKDCISFLDVVLLEASATQWFAIGLSKLYTVLSHLSLLTNRAQPLPYSTPELRHNLRLRPFMQLSIPEVPSYTELSAATSIDGAATSEDGASSTETQAMSVLDVAEKAIKVARKEWEAIGKLDAKTARYTNCEAWWRASIKDINRACIVCGIAIATVKKALQHADGRPLTKMLKVEDQGKNYHDFWVIPQVVQIKSG
ncbi:MAG: hypothetical protein Q9183_001225 [Haloplaca sp. 2 TL-2023]